MSDERRVMVPANASAVVVHSGDTLVIGLREDTTVEEFADLSKAFKIRLPDVRVILMSGVTSMRVRRG